MLPGKSVEHFHQLIHRHVLQENQIQHGLIVFRNLAGAVDLLGLHGLVLKIIQRNDPVKSARFGHAKAVDAQNFVQEIPGIQIARIAVSV